MRAPLLWLLAGLLWGGGLYLGGMPVVPWEVTLRPHTPPQPRAAPDPGRGVRLEVTRTFPHLEGLALGDRIQFDRYGVLLPTAGSVLCVSPPVRDTLTVTPIGGRIDHAGHLAVTHDAVDCPAPARPRPVVSVHP